ncbi:hypothetical protein JX265_004262 [Neoarthrinium moseri]|uniref:Zn(2)-C6 fungal-type domain-containing protein n=1 Tax=Neoarthrinium moseri TaxID=1658444 RepID=A0A9Q0AS94_9PEZI|nr:uncharacterized protein JN550_001944 [Neoarthrinium moseri]KAI1850552.1 hypothetical protein JX266_003834 [Neoarthrinium moseri]KAI1875204.1 hypothetical protein JX265_004262 [Neoarthrinium moseri]KAI1875658.1 hypothetical protein JN550_001944 [Neoarthrinium moseri]
MMKASRPLVTTGLSPLSDTSSVLGQGHSPHQRDRMEASYESEHANNGDLAHRACEKCRSSKRKCDKTLPYCTRCTRLNAKCVYLADSVGVNPGGNGAPVVIFQPHGLTNDVSLRGVDPLEDITASQILSLIPTDAQMGEKLDWSDAVRGYFDYVHSWYAVVHRNLFEQQLAALTAAVDSPQSQVTQVYSPPLTNSPSEKSVTPSQTVTALGSMSEPQMSREFALLIVTMHMVTRHRYTKNGERPMFDELYHFVKRVVALALLDSPLPRIELVQCGALLALYEYGHGDSLLAYRTLSEAAGAARVLEVKPGQMDGEGAADLKGELTMEEEQKGGLWWSLFILDQFIHRDEVSKNLPFVLESPELTTLLPGSVTASNCSRVVGHPGRFDVKYICEPPPPPRQRLPISVELNTRQMESFQLSAKVASLLHRALRHEHYVRTRPGYLPPVNSFSSLDAEIRRATMTLLQDDVANWQVTLDCFAMCCSALFSLYLPYLPVLETKSAAEIKQDADLSMALAALRFAAQLSTDISCKVNADIKRGEEGVALKYIVAPAAPTCYLVVKTYASLRRIFPEEWDHCQEAMVDKFESLRFFSYRWGIAEKMMRQLQEVAGLDRNEFIKPETLASISILTSGPMDLSR